MATVHNLKGTSVSSFQIGKQGPLVKNSSGQIDIRNTSDTAFSTLKAGDLHIDTSTGAVQLESLYTDVKEPTGFPNRTDTTLSFTVGTREFSIAPTGASFDVYIHGRKINVVGTQTLAISNSTGSHFLYIDSAGTLQETTTFSPALYSDYAICGIVYWNAVAGTAPYVADERHGVTMDFDTHSYLHNVLGSQWISGLTPGSILSDQDGSNNTHAQLSVANGVIVDEDIRISITDGSPEDLSPILTAPVFYRDGLSWVKDAAAVHPVKTGGTGRLAYNSFSTPNWGQTEIANNKFVLCHLMATNDIYYPVIALQGIAQYDTISAANSGASTELLELSGLPFAEFVPICTLVFQTSDSYTNTVKARIRQLDSGDDFIDWRQSHFKLLFSASGGTVDHANLTNLQGGTAGSYYHSDQPINTTDNVDFASVQVAAGSAASPSLSFSTDTNTGLYLSAADTIGFSANGTLLGTWSATGITISGDLTVQGTTTTIDATTLLVEDKNIELGVVAVPSDVTADGGGITLKGATDKSISWVNATDAWTSSEHVYLASGKQFQADAGTVSLPGYTFNSDLNSGLYSIGANRIGVSTDGVLRLEATATGSLVLGTGAIATNAADGFLYVPGTAGTPTGTPTAYAGRYPSIFDSTNEYSYTWNGSSWIKTKNTTDRIVQIGESGNTDTLDDLVSWMWATGTISGQVLTDNGNGTVDITAGTMYIKTTASDLGDLVKISTPSGTALALTDESVNYIYVDYNGGAPTLNVTTNVLAFDGLSKVILYKMGRSGNTITVLDVRFQSINSSRKNRRILYESTVYTKQKGKTLIAEAGTRNLTVTEGAFYYGYEKITHAAYDTTVGGVAAVNVFSYYYQDGIGGWTESTNQKQISNSLYDDGSGTLAAMTANYHRVDHVYIILDRTTPRLAVVYGDAEYPVLASAQAASEPTSLPPLIAATGVVIGRVIVKQGQAALSEVNNATLTGIERQIATDHNEFADIQGGSAGNYYHSNQAINTTDSPTFANALIGGVDFNGVLTAVKDPTGFPNRTDSVLSFVDGTRTFSITPVGASFDIYIKGVKYTKSAAQSVVIPNVSGPYYIYFDTAGTIQYTGTFTSDLITTYVYVAALFWNATSGALINLGDERHSCQMDQATHSYLHNVFGTRYGTGLQIGNYTTAGTGNTNSDAQLSITSGVIWDEDIRIAITDDPAPATNSFEQILSTAARLPIVYRSGTGTTNWYKSTATDYPLKLGTTLPQYNLNTAGTWTTPDTPTTNFLAMWVFATHDVREPVFALMGQRYDSTLANAQANAKYESLDLAGLPATEWKFLYRLIFETRTTYSNAVKSRLRDVTDYRTASLQGSATGASSSHSALSGLTDTNSHPASAISTTTTSFAGVLSTSDTDVQTALDTIDNHVHPMIVGTTSVTSGTVGALLFEGTGNIVQEDAANLFWDNTNNRLGIGTNAPDVLLHSETNTDGTVTNRIKNTDVGTNVLVRHAMTSSTGTSSIDLYGANNSTAIGGMAMNNATVLQGVNGGDVMIRGVGSSDVWFATNNVISAGLSSGGNFLIGSTTDDTLNKLQITGSAKVTSDLTVQAEIYAGSGAVGTPSYSFGSDTNSGLYSIGADQIGVAIGGVNVATFSSTGISAAGIVSGPATSTVNYVPQWNSTDGKILKDGLAVGTAANNLVQLDGSAKLPAVDGSALTNLPVAGGGGSAFKNLIIGGDFTTNPWQRGTTRSSLTGEASYVADRFAVLAVGSGIVDVLKTEDAPTVVQAGVGTKHCLNVDVTTADATMAAADRYNVYTKLEGLTTQFLGWGAAGAKSVTLSFWHKHTKTGTYCVSLKNNAETQTYIAEYTQSASDTWEFASITVPGSTTGTWEIGTGRGLVLTFAIAGGSNYQAAANAWASNLAFCTSSQVNALDSTSNNFRIALIQLEVGSTASDFEVLPVDVVLARCLRYCYVLGSGTTSEDGLGYRYVSGHAANSSQGNFVIPFPVQMRSAPTYTLSGPAGNFIMQYGTYASVACSSITGYDYTQLSAMVTGVGVSGPMSQGNGIELASLGISGTKLIFSAEL